MRRLQKAVIPRNLQMPPGYGVAARYEPSQIEVAGSQPVILTAVRRPDLTPPTTDQNGNPTGASATPAGAL